MFAHPLSYLSPYFHRHQPPGSSILHCYHEGFSLPDVWLSPGLCVAIFIGETGRTLGRFAQHFRSIEENLPGFLDAEHFNAAGHSVDDVLFRVNLLCGVKSQQKRLAFELGTSHPRGLNFDFHFLLAPRAQH